MATDHPVYPGNPQHQALLRAIVAHYAGDARVRAVALFGSLARGTWDDYSDLDLDIVITDDTRLDVIVEVRALCASLERIGEHATLVVPHESDAADVVFASLNQFSIRYHPLAATSPNIVSHLLVLGGPLDAGSIIAAGQINRTDAGLVLAPLVDACVRDGLYVAINLRRLKRWWAIALLQRMRERIIELFSLARDGIRARDALHAYASAELLADLGRTLPQDTSESIVAALDAALSLLETRLDEVTAGRLALSDDQRATIAAIRTRLLSRV